MRQVSPLNRASRAIGLVLGAALLAVAAAHGPAGAVPQGNPVETETIIGPPDRSFEPGMPAVPSDETEPPAPAPAARPAALPDLPIPEVLYDLSKLPGPVARMRQQIIDAAATGDIEKLRPIIEAGNPPPQLSLDKVDGDPIAFLKSSSGDEGGREILAILSEVLEAGFVNVHAGSTDEMYVWPYFAYYPVDKLSPRQLVELFKLVYAGDYEDMKAYGTYLYYRVGISSDGKWQFFLAGE